jgi:hypothetical protein
MVGLVVFGVLALAGVVLVLHLKEESEERRGDVAVVQRFIAMNIFKQIALGNHLTKMTNWMEAIESTRLSMPIGAGGGLDSLSPDQRARATRDLELGMATMAKYPRHVVTAELLKNQQVALQLGRHSRAEAQEILFDYLVERGVALGTEEFLKSYA